MAPPPRRPSLIERLRVARQALFGRPKLGATNLAGSSIGGGFEGAQRQRRLFGFRPTEAAINSLLIMSAPTLRARARFLVRNNGWALKAQNVFVSYLTGTGIRPMPLVADAGQKTAIAEAFEAWTDDADLDGLTDFYGLQALAAAEIFEAGEVFIRKHIADEGEGDSDTPLRLQLMESEFCPYELNMIGANGNAIRSGIEFDAKKPWKRVAYWFWRTHPGEFLLPIREVGYMRVPAEEIIHLFKPLRAGQIRGCTWLGAAIVRTYLLDQYEDAELDRKKTAALFAGFITQPDADDPMPPLGQQDQPAVGTADPTLNAPEEVIAGLTPGMLQVLGVGEDIKFSQPADVGPNFEAFFYRAILAVCAAMGVPYAATTGDYSKANYSSLRAAQLDLRRSLEQIQHTVMAFQLCRGVWRWFIAEAVLAGAIPVTARVFNAARAMFLRAKWTPPKFEWVDPLKDVQAARLAVRSGLSSRASVVASLGENVERVDAEMASDNKRADDLGLVLDSDPRRTDARGSAPPPDSAPPAAKPGDEAADAAAADATSDEEEEAA